MSETIFKGTLRPALMPDLLRALRAAGRTGALVVTRGHDQSLLYLAGTVLVDATSSRPEQRLSHRLVSEGVLSPSAYDALLERLEAGRREAPALVEMGALEPRALWERCAAQVLDAAAEPFGWDRGEYLFVDGLTPEAGRFRHRIRLADLAAEGLRRVRDRDLFRDCIPSGELVLEPAPEELEPNPGGDGRARLLPYEEYVCDLLDGKRTAAEVAGLSELGEFETYRALHLLLVTAHARLVLPEAAANGSGDLRPILRQYNDLLTRLQQHLVREVGPIAAQLLEKSLREARGLQPALLEGVGSRPEGSLDEPALERNLRRLPPERRREAAIVGLNEVLYSFVLAIKRTLGVEHEAEAVRLLRSRAAVGHGLGA